MELEGKKVAIMLEQLYQEMEVWYPYYRLIEAGGSVVVVEHNLEVVKTADWILDLGPEGGDKGGRVIASGTPEEVAQAPGSYTGAYLAPHLRLGLPGTKKRA